MSKKEKGNIYGLSEKQVLFCHEYMKDMNGTQAYLRAGFKVSEKTAGVNASKLLKNSSISAYLTDLKDERVKKVDISAQWVLERLIQVAERCMQAEPVMEYDYQTQTMVETGEYQFDSNGANKSLELIGKHIGMFDPKYETIRQQALKQLEKMSADKDKVLAETEFIRERIRLLKGATKDTSLMEALIQAVKGDK